MLSTNSNVSCDLIAQTCNDVTALHFIEHKLGLCEKNKIMSNTSGKSHDDGDVEEKSQKDVAACAKRKHEEAVSIACAKRIKIILDRSDVDRYLKSRNVAMVDGHVVVQSGTSVGNVAKTDGHSHIDYSDSNYRMELHDLQDCPPVSSEKLDHLDSLSAEVMQLQREAMSAKKILNQNCARVHEELQSAVDDISTLEENFKELLNAANREFQQDQEEAQSRMKAAIDKFVQCFTDSQAAARDRFQTLTTKLLNSQKVMKAEALNRFEAAYLSVSEIPTFVTYYGEKRSRAMSKSAAYRDACQKIKNTAAPPMDAFSQTDPCPENVS
jgi:prepilin-type processing-associated H-X9-DG protein